jgi:hypothetical protein
MIMATRLLSSAEPQTSAGVIRFKGSFVAVRE